ncbi:hypothetical protein [Halococcus agarilyticus]|uniref:hypothetical protein n=1 Tax=Halococcus agarilyticus TaxID=1232219 RepID=UPI000677AC73|nr:hypothetical protein [Halococcus agarilyticus]
MTTRSDAQFVLSGFADEIDDSLTVQLDVLCEPGIGHIDLRGIDGTNVLDLSDGAGRKAVSRAPRGSNGPRQRSGRCSTRRT